MPEGKGYLLPAVIDPVDRIYVCVPVPDEAFHRLAFLAQLEMLSWWYTWARDDDRTGREVAAVWREIVEQVRAQIDAGEGCGVPFDVRISGCNLEKSTDGGETWIVVGDLSSCSPINSAAATTLPAGSSATATISAGVLQLGIPTGATGATGATGFPGPKGDKGDKGDPGICGCEDEPDIPPNTGDLSGQYCSMAGYIVSWLDGLWNDTLNAVDASNSIVEIVSELAEAAAPNVISFITGTVNSVIALGTSAARAAVTTEILEEVKCDLFCLLEQNDGYSEAVFNSWISGISTSYPSNVGIQLWAGLSGWYDSAIWQQRAYIGSLSTSNDCTACECDDEWCYTFDFTQGDQGWTRSSPANAGVYVAGTGWRTTSGTYYGSTRTLVDIRRAMTGVTVTRVEMAYNFTKNPSTNTSSSAAYMGDGSGSMAGTTLGGETNGTGKNLAFTGSRTINGFLQLQVQTSFLSSGGVGEIIAVTLRGIGTNPFGEDNCY